MAKETAIVKKDETALALTDEMLTGPKGGETLDVKDMSIPYVELTQGQSGSVTRMDNPMPVGVWHNSMTDTNYGKEISVVILDAIGGYQLKELVPGTDKKKLVATRWRSAKIKSWNPEMITDEMISSRTFKKGAANLLGDAFCYQAIVNGKDLCLITLKSSACNEARKLNTLLMTATMEKDGKKYSLPFYASQFKFTAKWVDKGIDKKYWDLTITPDGMTRPQLLKALYDMVKDLGAKTVSAQETEETEDKQAF
jgi:hypothetical protein